MLNDGRLFVVEYKGELENAADSAEKENLGQLWASKSDGKGIFLMARIADKQGRNLKEQIAASVG